MVDEPRFREMMTRFPTGVSVVTTRDADGRDHGLTVNSFCSVSLDPALILVCVNASAQSHDALLSAGVFAVNVLCERDRALAVVFSAGERGRRFEGVPVRRAVTGSPILESAHAWFDCAVWQVHAAGDHSIIVGEVRDVGGNDQDPLIFHMGGYERSLR